MTDPTRSDTDSDPTSDSAGTRPSLVRAYTLTGGRTAAAIQLALEARITIDPAASRRTWRNPLARRIAEMERRTSSVAEIAAELDQPLGVVRVVIGDLVEAGAASVEQTMTDDMTTAERRDLMERTLRGLREL